MRLFVKGDKLAVSWAPGALLLPITERRCCYGRPSQSIVGPLGGRIWLHTQEATLTTSWPPEAILLQLLFGEVVPLPVT